VSTALLAGAGAKIEARSVQKCNSQETMNTIARNIETEAGFKTLVLSPRQSDSLITVEDVLDMPIVNPLVLRCGKKIVGFVGRLHNPNHPEILELIEPDGAMFTVYTNKHHGHSSPHPLELGVISMRHVHAASSSSPENVGFNSDNSSEVGFGIVVADALDTFAMFTLNDRADLPPPML
jgi:hypothetical protein